MMVPRRAPKGFSLIEVLVAVALLAVVAAVGLEAFGGSLSLVRRSDDAQRWVQVAQSRIEVVRASEGLSPGRQEGETPDGVVWAVDLTPVEPVGDEGLAGASLRGLLLADVRAGDGRGGSVHLQTVVASGAR